MRQIQNCLLLVTLKIMCRRSGSYSSLYVVAAAATALNIGIVSIHPKRDPLYNQVFWPIDMDIQPTIQVAIMWTTAEYESERNFVPNHFCALLERREPGDLANEIALDAATMEVDFHSPEKTENRQKRKAAEVENDDDSPDLICSQDGLHDFVENDLNLSQAESTISRVSSYTPASSQEPEAEHVGIPITSARKTLEHAQIIKKYLWKPKKVDCLQEHH